MRCLLLLLALTLHAGPGAAQETEKEPEPAPRDDKEKAGPGAREQPAAPEIPADWPPSHKDDFQKNRDWMVRTQIQERGISDAAVLEAMRHVPRHRFVPHLLRRYAYEDRPLPIGHDQTISQPYIVASMTAELNLKKGMKVLEIGTGSGYQAAVLARITPWVFTIEIKKPLAATAKANLKRLGYTTVQARRADGYYGWPEAAPFDAILVTAAVPHVPPPLVRQLKPGGRMVLPVGPPFRVQDLRLVTKDEKGRVRSRSLYAVRFVPLTGSLGRKEGEKPEPPAEPEGGDGKKPPRETEKPRGDGA